MSFNSNQFRLGYACINTTLANKGISVNTSCILKTIHQKGKDILIQKTKNNLEALINIIHWNHKHNIHVYRMSSNMFPHISNPKLTNDQYFYDLSIFSDYFLRIAELQSRYNMRLTFHPDHFCKINSPHDSVFSNTSRDLFTHADFLDRIYAPPDSVMVLHGGGIYGDKQSAISRFKSNFLKLHPSIQKRIVLENCERAYSINDLLPICIDLNIPLVWDTHHFDCWNLIYPHNSIPIPDHMHHNNLFHQVINTWKRRNITPKIHISEQAPLKRIGAHSDYILEIPDYVWHSRRKLDIMLEAKQKELAVIHLRSLKPKNIIFNTFI